MTANQDGGGGGLDLSFIHASFAFSQCHVYCNADLEEGLGVFVSSSGQKFVGTPQSHLIAILY